MTALIAGTKAPDFSLSAVNGDRISLSGSLKLGLPVVLAFFKVSCPVCQFAFPYLERLHRANSNVPIFGVSQDDVDATLAFCKMYGVTFPVVLDSALRCTVDYDLTNVPTVFLITKKDGEAVIEQTIVGFDKQGLEDLNSTLKLHSSGAHINRSLFTDADEVPALRPG